MSNLSIRLFGPFEVVYDGERLSHFRTLKVQALLAYLVTSSTVTHQRETLMALLWPDLPPASAQTNLRQIVYQLRKAIPTVASHDSDDRIPFLLSEQQTVGVNPLARNFVDAIAFDVLAAFVHRHEHASVAGCSRCRNRLEEAVALYRRSFLADFYLEDNNEFEDWAHGRRGAYRSQTTGALATLAESYMRSGDYVQAEHFARRQLEMDNLDERAYRQLMEALARDGRRNEATATNEIARRLLRDELGMSPSTQTARLAAQIKTDGPGKKSGIVPEPPPAVRGCRTRRRLPVARVAAGSVRRLAGSPDSVSDSRRAGVFIGFLRGTQSSARRRRSATATGTGHGPSTGRDRAPPGRRADRQQPKALPPGGAAGCGAGPRQNAGRDRRPLRSLVRPKRSAGRHPRRQGQCQRRAGCR